ncbi:MAG: hypothetical protein DMF60_16670, partial [Acidobacteria bacterium]
MGSMTIAGQSFTVNQEAACGSSIAPTSQNFSSSGGTGSVSVTAGAGCTWMATSNAGFITITSGSSGSGNGTVGYSVAANTGAARMGSMTIAGQSFTVNQEAACSFSIAPITENFSTGGGTSGVGVTAGTGCSWTAISNAPWISIPNTTSGSGNGVVDYTVAPNSGAPRTGTITIAGLTFVVSQEGIEVCSYSINPTQAGFTGNSGTGSIVVTAASGCGWAASSSQSWITITSGTSGNGNGIVNYSVEENRLQILRQGTIIIAQNVVTVTQEACYFTFPFERSQDFAAQRVTSSLTVYSMDGCTWTAVSNHPWITINSGSSNRGTGTVAYEVAENTGPARTGTMTIAGQTFTVNQVAPGPCPYELRPQSESFAAANMTPFALNTEVDIKAPLGCEWTAVSNAPWINILRGQASGN